MKTIRNRSLLRGLSLSILSLGLISFGSGCSSGSSAGGGGGAGGDSVGLASEGAPCVRTKGAYFLQSADATGEAASFREKAPKFLIIADDFAYGSPQPTTAWYVSPENATEISSISVWNFKGPECTEKNADEEFSGTTRIYENGGAVFFEITQIKKSTGAAVATLRMVYSRDPSKESAKNRIAKEAIDTMRSATSVKKIDDELEDAYKVEVKNEDRIQPINTVSDPALKQSDADDDAAKQGISDVTTLAMNLFNSGKLAVQITSGMSTLAKTHKNTCNIGVSNIQLELLAKQAVIKKLGEMAYRISRQHSDVASRASVRNALNDDSKLGPVRKYFESKRHILNEVLVAYTNELNSGKYSNDGDGMTALAGAVSIPTSITTESNIKIDCPTFETRDGKGSSDHLVTSRLGFKVTKLDNILRASNKHVLGYESFVMVMPLDYSSQDGQFILNSVMAHELRHVIDIKEHPELIDRDRMSRERSLATNSYYAKRPDLALYAKLSLSNAHKDYINAMVDSSLEKYPAYSEEEIRRQIVKRHKASFGSLYYNLYIYQAQVIESRGFDETIRFYRTQGYTKEQFNSAMAEFNRIALASLHLETSANGVVDPGPTTIVQSLNAEREARIERELALKQRSK